MGEGAVDEDVVEVDAFVVEGLEHKTVGGPEGVFGVGRRAKPVLVADHDEEVVGVGAEEVEVADDAWEEAELFVGVDLLVGRFAEDGAVAVDEEDFLFHGSSRG